MNLSDVHTQMYYMFLIPFKFFSVFMPQFVLLHYISIYNEGCARSLHFLSYVWAIVFLRLLFKAESADHTDYVLLYSAGMMKGLGLEHLSYIIC
jgi:hypothetical protein